MEINGDLSDFECYMFLGANWLSVSQTADILMGFSHWCNSLLDLQRISKKEEILWIPQEVQMIIVVTIKGLIKAYTIEIISAFL